MLHAVIMAGGSGTRFWPASRAHLPKQLLKLTGERSMLQATKDRLSGLVSADQILIVTNQRLVDPIRDQLPDLPDDSVLGEPCKRDTAPCIGLAAALIGRKHPDAVMAVMPADHVISSRQPFQNAIGHAVELVDQNPDRLVTFGIRPTYPAESFGYIERAEPVDDRSAYRVQQFREKPNADLAGKYLESGMFYWNSGIFVWKAKTILQRLQEYEPAMFGHIQKIAAEFESDRFAEVFRDEFEQIRGISIDYAVMERAPEVVVIEAGFDWDDVGTWTSLGRLLGSDDDGNTSVEKCITIDTKNTILRSEKDHLIAAVGVKDLIIVHTSDATLVANRADEESIRKIVERLEQEGLPKYL